MARQVRRISELPEATGLTGDELLEIVQDGDNHRVRVGDLPGGGGGGAVQSVQGRTGDVVITADDVGLGSADNTSDADKPVSTAQQAALDGKVDAVAGMGLSSNDFTDPLRDKLIGLEGTHWRGTFPSKAALEADIPTAAAGDYADVDTVGDDVVRYIWDTTDAIWVAQSGEVAPITASQVKLLYESNPDTNAFTDADESKLDGIAAGATANSTDAHLLNRANHTGTQAISTVAGLQGELDSKIGASDTRLTNSREWTAETVSQAEAEAGTADTRRAWTALRVRQAIAAWWNGISGAAGREIIAQEYVPFSFAQKNDDQDVPASTFTKVNYGQSVVDSGGDYSSANSLFVATVAGTYLVYASVLYTPAAGQRTALAVYVNGVSVITLADSVAAAAAITVAAGTSVLMLDAGDVVAIYFFSGDTVETLQNNPINSKFIVRRL